jgi:hypothetical protein
MKPKFSTGGPRFRSTVLPQALPANRVRDPQRASTPNGLATDTYNFASPPPAVNNDGMGNYFGALRVSNDRSGIPYAMVHLRPQILRLLNGLNRKMLAAVGRYLVDNGGVASYAVSLIANYSVPVTPHSLCEDKNAALKYEEYFQNWCKICDYTRRFDFDELQRIVCMAIDTDGDIGATMTLKSGFPQVRFFDTFHIGKLTGLDPMDGIVADDKDGGVLKGYHVIEGAIDTLESQALTFMPVEQLLLLRDPARYDNYRGYSPIRRGSNDLRDQEDIKAFTKLKEKISAALAAVIQQNGMVEEDLWGNDSGSTGTNAVTADDPNQQPNDKKLSLAELLGGDIPIIEGEIKQLEHKAHGVNAIEFLNYLAGQFVAGLDIPPSFFLDEKLTGPNIRAVIGKAQRKFDQRKKVISRFVEFCWMRVIAHGIATKQIPATAGWEKISFQFPPLLSIDLGDVMANERADVMVGQMSEKERFGNRGKNSIAEHKQIVSEVDTKLDAAMKLYSKYNEKVPLQLILTRFGFAASVSTAVPPEDSKTQNTEQK